MTRRSAAWGGKGDPVLLSALRSHIGPPYSRDNELVPFLEAAKTIREGLPLVMSIDNFIDIHREDKWIELCGKLAIARSILNAERKSKLYVDRTRPFDHPDYKKLTGTWFIEFFRLLTENCGLNELANRLSSVRIVVFNYDRCVEHYLYHSLQTVYRMGPEQAAHLVNGLEIYHPYGTVGTLPWQGKEGSVEFGGEPEGAQLLSLASQIKTFTEGTDPTSSAISIIRQRVQEADILVFLGFAFHRLNMKLLAEPRSVKSSKKGSYFATALKISRSDCDIITGEIAAMKGYRPVTLELRNDLTCGQLLPEYWRSLSLS